jgi:hypothetical protein
MRTILRVFTPLLFLVLGAAALPVAAAEGAAGAAPATAAAAPATAAATPAPAAQPAHPPAAASPAGKLASATTHRFPPGKVAAIIAGAVIVGTAADVTFSGGLFTVVGVVVGAALGSVWYERGMWPF